MHISAPHRLLHQLDLHRRWPCPELFYFLARRRSLGLFESTAWEDAEKGDETEKYHDVYAVPIAEGDEFGNEDVWKSADHWDITKAHACHLSRV